MLTSTLARLIIFVSFLCLASAVRADPVQIVSGSAQNADFFGREYSFTAQNADGSLSTNIRAGNIFLIGFASAPLGQVMNLNLNVSGTDAVGTFTHQGITWFSFSTINFTANALMPSEIINGLTRIGGTFTFDGTLVGSQSRDPQEATESIHIPVFGSGIVDGFVDWNGSSYTLQSVSYRFQETQATPEPSTLLLLSGSLFAAAWRLRKRNPAAGRNP